jgi:hypothetical protein
MPVKVYNFAGKLGLLTDFVELRAKSMGILKIFLKF